MPSKPARKSPTSRSSWAPVSRSSSERTVPLPAWSSRQPKPRRCRRGRSSSRSARPSMNRVMRWGASRKSRAFGRGRGVEHDALEVGLLDQLVEALDRHVLLGARDGAREVAVDAVLEDPVARLVVGGIAGDQPVEGGLGVELQGPELAAALDQGVGRHPLGLVGEARHAERRRQPPRRVDGDHHRLGALAGEAQRRPRPRSVVLPTPPAPQHTTRRRVRSSSIIAAPAAAPAQGVDERRPATRSSEVEAGR